jgi:RNA polymerase primary sigma factor
MARATLRENVPEDLLAVFLEDIGRHPLLTPAEEVDLAKRIEAGRAASEKLATGVPEDERAVLQDLVDQGNQARSRFLESNMRLVVSVAKRYRTVSSSLELVDLIQDGSIGLMRAVDKFDWRRGFKFSTYATWWIRQAVTRALQEKGRTIRVPPRLHNVALKARNAITELQAESGRRPTVDEIAERSGLDPRDVDEALRVGDAVSLEAPIGDDGAQLGDFIVTDDDPSPEGEVIDADIRARLLDAIDRLDDRERLILRERFGFRDGAPRSRSDIGALLGVTGERVGQIERAVLSKIRHPAFGLREEDFE